MDADTVSLTVEMANGESSTAQDGSASSLFTDRGAALNTVSASAVLREITCDGLGTVRRGPTARQADSIRASTYLDEGVTISMERSAECPANTGPVGAEQGAGVHFPSPPIFLSFLVDSSLGALCLMNDVSLRVFYHESFSPTSTTMHRALTQCSRTLSGAASDRVAHLGGRDVVEIALDLSSGPMGLEVEGGCDSDEPHLGIRVVGLRDNGIAFNKLLHNDEILSLNGESLNGKTHDQCIERFVAAIATQILLVLTVARDTAGEIDSVVGDLDIYLDGHLARTPSTSNLNSSHRARRPDVAPTGSDSEEEV